MTHTLPDLSGFTGSEHLYRHALVKSIHYTDGVKYLADTCGAYWLIDKIAISQAEPILKNARFQVWRLFVRGNEGKILVEDGNGYTIYKEDLDYTDFPSRIDIWFADNTILLPSEY